MVARISQKNENEAPPPTLVRANGSVGVRAVARAAGVSTATVSRSLNRPEVVSEELRTRIAAVIEHLGFVPDAAARALSTRRSGTVGAIFPTLTHGDFARAATALQNELLVDGYILLLACSDYDYDQELRQVRKFVERGVDGVVLVGNEHRPELERLLRRQSVPWINTFVYDPAFHGRSIGPDNRKVMVDMTNYLIGLGHRQFAVIWPSVGNNDRAAARLEGIASALAEQGLSAWPHHQMSGEAPSIGAARVLFRRAMQASVRPTAVICGNAYAATGAELEALSMGLSIPGDLSIVGYDDIELMSELPIPITTVRVPGDKIGQSAARYLLGRILERNETTQFEVRPEIVFRSSSAPPSSVL